MRPSDSDLPHNQTYVKPVPGWWLNYIAGFIPFIAGIIVLFTNWISVFHPDANWWVGFGSLDFSYTSLNLAGDDATAYVEMLGSVGGVHIVAAAIAVIVVARFGLREGQRWAWWFLAFCLLWIGLHDLVMATRFYLATGVPFIIMPLTYSVLMLAGLIKSRPALFP